jgi:flagellar protein FlaG
MKVDAGAINSNTLQSTVSSNTPKAESERSITESRDNVVMTIHGKSISQLTDTERKDMTMSDKMIIEAIERANRAILGANKEFHFSIHEATKQIQIKVLDKETKEIIREIPSEKVLDMVAKMWEMAGIMVDERR